MRTTYLYRAVSAEPITFAEDGEEWTEPAGAVTFGRASGYLSRSGAVNAGRESGQPFEVVRSEPVVFLTRRQKLEREIERLRAELDITA
ncbi:MAG: hypothetical protein QM630_01085 [Microbacterium sp.]